MDDLDGEMDGRMEAWVVGWVGGWSRGSEGAREGVASYPSESRLVSPCLAFSRSLALAGANSLARSLSVSVPLFYFSYCIDLTAQLRVCNSLE